MNDEKILLIDKPIGWTSNDILRKLKSILNVKKIGHAGTLDPNASGLLIIAINENTKLLSKLILDDKQYKTIFQFGISTTTADATGQITNNCSKKVTLEEIKKYIEVFYKENYFQTPHKYSAIKVNGKKAYEYARLGISIELKPKLVKILDYKIVNFDYEKQLLEIILTVSKGFYIRSFCEDLAKKVGTFAYVKQLRRVKCGKFDISMAKTISDYETSKKTRCL